MVYQRVRWVVAKSGTTQFLPAPGNWAIPKYSADGRVITVEGFQIGRIDCLGEIYDESPYYYPFTDTHREVVKSWLKLALNGSQPDFPIDRSPEWMNARITEFWKTLIGNRTFDKRGTDEDYFRQMFDVLFDESSLPVDFVHLPSETEADEKGRFVVPFKVEIGDWLRLRRFFTSDNATMGVCWPTAQIGSKLVILAGCDAPVLLRSVGKNNEFHGDAYVSGFMDGEAMELLNKRKLRWEKFSIQ